MAGDYYRIKNIEKRLGRTDTDLNGLITQYGADIDSIFHNEIRRHLGSADASGTAIVLPLTSNTTPAIDVELQMIADNAIIGMIRDDQANNQEIKDRAIDDLKKYLVKRFGYVRDLPYDFTGLANLT